MAQQQLNGAVSPEEEENEKENGNTTIGVCCEQRIAKVTD